MGSKPIRSDVKIPTTSFSRVFCTNDIMSVHSDVIYHHFPISSQYLKTWGVDSPVTYTGSREKTTLLSSLLSLSLHYRYPHWLQKNERLTYTSATFSRDALICIDWYAKSPESSLTPTAWYPKSFRAKATAQKAGMPLLR